MKKLISTQSSESEKKYDFLPKSFEETFKFAELISKTDMCPRDYKGKIADIVIAIGTGSSLGLAPIPSLHNISVINGRPAIWGDGARALLLSHRDCLDIEEWFEGSEEDKTLTAFCKITRRGKKSPFIAKFSMNDALKAGLINKDIYKKYLRRMLQCRSFGFASRDAFSDVLKGVITQEEANDYKVTKDVKESIDTEILDAILGNKIDEPVEDEEIIVKAIYKIQSTSNIEELNMLGDEIKNMSLSNDQKVKVRNFFKQKRDEFYYSDDKNSIRKVETNEIYDSENTLEVTNV
jgi:hypothetical protein